MLRHLIETDFDLPWAATAGRSGIRHRPMALLLCCLGVLGGAGTVASGAAADAASARTNSFSLPEPLKARRESLPSGLRKPAPETIAELHGIEDHVKALVKKVSPATVAVEVGGATGSGVIISSNGLVLTAAHVAGSPDRPVVFTFPDGKRVRGKTVGAEKDSDAGLMKIGENGPWPFVPLGELETAMPGDWVVALGHPGGFDSRRSLVVRLGRLIRIRGDTLQSDCTISPGDSGGPLFDMHGRVIGIHTTISGSTSDNFHVPITQFYSQWNAIVSAKTREGT
jgi:serine protease Do